MELKTYFAQDASGNIMPGATVMVYEAATTTLATGLQDESGSPLTNPFTADSSAKVAFYAPDGLYDITVVGNGRTVTIRAQFVSVDGASVLRDDLAAPGGSALVGAGAGRTQADKNSEQGVSVLDYSSLATPSNWQPAFSVALAGLSQRQKFVLPYKSGGYKITQTVSVLDKAGCLLDFGNQRIDASGIASSQDAVVFRKNSQAVINNVFVLGNLSFVDRGVLFDAATGEITIHSDIGKVYASDCKIGIQVGVPTHQFSDSVMADLYASDCTTGILLTGENTLAMQYGKVAAYNCTTYGIRIEQGGGWISSLQSAASGTDVFIGSLDGTNHNKLNRWDIASGYSEEGVLGERFIASAACTDGNYFKEQIVFRGMRVTPFTSTNVTDFVDWRLNGDLIFENCTFACGQQNPRFKVASNTAYRPGRIIINDCVFDIAPTIVGAEPPMLYTLGSNKESVVINSRVNNAISAWNNNGAADITGTVAKGIYHQKLDDFVSRLAGVNGLVGAWDLRDLPSGACKNIVAGGAPLSLSAAMEQRDFWADDGLVGFLRSAGTTSKTISTTSSAFAASGAYTFGCILRATTSGSSEENYTNIGGTAGIRLSIGSGGLLCIVGGANAFVGVTNPYDAHLVIGRYESGAAIRVDAINLRTGEYLSGVTTGGVPAFGSLTWSNGVNLRNDLCVRGMPFVYSRALTDNEVGQLLQTAMLLTDSWRS